MSPGEEGGQGLTEAGKGLDSILRLWESQETFQLGASLGLGKRPGAAGRGQAGWESSLHTGTPTFAPGPGAVCAGGMSEISGFSGAPGDTMRPSWWMSLGW